MSKSRQLSDAINSVDISESAPADAVTLDASGDLHIGKTATNFTVTGATLKGDGTTQFTRDGNQVALFNRLTSDGTIIDLRKDGTTVGSIGVDQTDWFVLDSNNIVALRNSNNADVFWDTTNAWRPGVDNAYDLGRSTARWKDLYLSGGVYLGGTGAANYLDDYEEGTWSVTLTPGTSGSYNSYSSRSANYTKIGNMVSVRVIVTVADGGASSPVGTTVQLSLPFTSSSSGAASFLSLSSNSTSRNAFINNSLSYATLYVDASTVVWGGAGNDVAFEATYRTDS